ncbi:MAG: aminotransferase class I/II-fold pyridoxal phosphate-dependent enzyme [Polyangiaceae bacterium]|nr:aminotransferase class I/II-fold pyridoxal phosphate-dependent enzyme [Polyangiaceae bacterium]
MPDPKDIFAKVRAGLYSPKTALLHGRFRSERWDYNHHVVPPISSSTTYRLESTARGAQGFVEFANKKIAGAHSPIYIYDRLDEPTRGMLEEVLAFAESGDACVTFATGMAAVSASLGVTVKAGERILSHHPIYGCTYSLFTNWMPRMSVGVDFVDMADLDALAAAVRPETRAVYLESPANPTLEIVDIAGIHGVIKGFNRERAPEHKIEIIVDNTFATPFCQRPLELGADISVHSLTKGLGGFGTEMGGAVIAKARYQDSILLYRKDLGGVLAPTVAWAILTHGLPTLSLRMKRQQETALRVAEYLADHPKVGRVHYPGLHTFPGYEIARRQMIDYDGNFAPGSMIYFELAGEPDAARVAAQRFCDHVATNAYSITLAVSLGQIRTLVESPGLMTHSALPPEEQRRTGITPGGVRLSIGIEEPHDILHDLGAALAAA